MITAVVKVRLITLCKANSSSEMMPTGGDVLGPPVSVHITSTSSYSKDGNSTDRGKTQHRIESIYPLIMVNFRNEYHI